MTDKEIKRGDIYYVYPDNYIGSEQGGGRPAIVVSNDMGNRYAPIVSVVFLSPGRCAGLAPAGGGYRPTGW